MGRDIWLVKLILGGTAFLVGAGDLTFGSFASPGTLLAVGILVLLTAICHAPWLLVEAGVLEGRNATSYKSIATDVRNAGATWHDKEVVVDNGIVTSRSPKDLDAFVGKIIEEISEGRHERSAA